MVLEMAMESVFAVVDVFWVSRLGPDAIATVGLTESMLTLVYTAAMGLSIGVSAVVARRIGEKRPDAAAEAAVQGIALGLVVAAAVAVLGVTLAPKLLSLMGASPGVIGIGSGYTRVMLGGGATVLLLLEIPLAYVLARVAGFGPFGVFLAITVGYSSLALVSAALFRRGRWKLRQV